MNMLEGMSSSSSMGMDVFEDSDFDLEFDLGTEESVPKKTKVYIVQVLLYLYNMRVPFDTRMGLKKAYYSIERTPMVKEMNQAMKEFYTSVNMTPHASGEFPVPENLEQYQYLEQTIISEDCSSFKPKNVSEFRNAIEADLHQKAVEVYREKHYRGSEEEAADLAREITLLYAQKAKKKQAIISELEYLENKAEVEVPDDCRFINQSDVCIDLIIGSYDSFITTHINGIHDRFDEKESRYGVKYRISKDFGYFTAKEHDIYAENSALLASMFVDIDNYKGFIPLSILEVLKEDMHDGLHYRCRYTSKQLATPISEKDEIMLKQMVEDFFETKGIVGKTILPEPIVMPFRFR